MNHLSAATQAHARMDLPEGWTCAAESDTVAIDRGAQGAVHVSVRAPATATVRTRHVITAAITLGERRFGPVAEGIIHVGAGATP